MDVACAHRVCTVNAVRAEACPVELGGEIIRRSLRLLHARLRELLCLGVQERVQSGLGAAVACQIGSGVGDTGDQSPRAWCWVSMFVWSATGCQ